MREEESKIELSKYRKHQRKFPWGLIRKLVIAIVMMGLIYYLFDQLQSSAKDNVQEEEDSIPIEISE